MISMNTYIQQLVTGRLVLPPDIGQCKLDMLLVVYMTQTHLQGQYVGNQCRLKASIRCCSS
jgi:hypothetical protein